jgi:hypothetical protein
MMRRDVIIHRQKCCATLDMNDNSVSLELKTPEHTLAITRSRLEAIINELDHERLFIAAFPELKPRFQNPLRTTALRLARQALNDAAVRRITEG